MKLSTIMSVAISLLMGSALAQEASMVPSG